MCVGKSFCVCVCVWQDNKCAFVTRNTCEVRLQVNDYVHIGMPRRWGITGAKCGDHTSNNTHAWTLRAAIKSIFTWPQKRLSLWVGCVRRVPAALNPRRHSWSCTWQGSSWGDEASTTTAPWGFCDCWQTGAEMHFTCLACVVIIVL